MTEQKKIFGNYLGMVVANDDPLKKGRVKLFIPHLSPDVYKNWNESSKDKKFKFLGKNINSPVDDILEDLKLILPWAECASPLVGEVSSGRYNSANQVSTISDSNDYSSAIPKENFQTTKYSQNPDGVGEKPANILEKYNFALKDAFVSPGATGTNKANLYGQNYRPASYSNKAKGSFSIPPVGSHLWAFFIDGNPMYPVYFAASHGAKEWQDVYEVTDYPGAFENQKSTDKKDHNTEIYRNKYLFNQKGGTLEFINTDNKEAVKISHYSGSSIQLTTPTSIYLSTANEQHLIQGDKFETIRGSDNFYVDGDKDTTIRGDVYRKIGSLDSGATQRWKDLMQSVADIKQLFEIQRVKDKQLFNSVEQSKAGSYGPCPVCSQNRAYDTLQNNPFGSVGTSSVLFASNEVTQYTQVDARGVQPPGDAQNKALPSVGRCPVCNGTGLSPSSMGGKWTPDPAKQQLASLIQSKVVDLSKAEADLGLGGHEIVEVTKHKIETIGLVMNDFGSIRVDSEGKIYNSSVYVGPEGVYERQTSSPLIEYVHVDDLPGGNYTLNVCNRYTLQVGAGGISMKSFGPIQIGGTIINMSGEQVNLASSNEVNIDGGKRLTLTSDIMVFKQRQMGQVLVDSSLGVSRNLIVGGGAHIEGELTVNHITAPVEIQETEYTRLYGEANSDAAPTGAGGGTGYVIGYVSGFASDWVTENGRNWTRVYSRVPNVSYPSPGSGSPSRNSIQNYDHSHHFRNIPLTLVASNTDLRTAAAGNNNSDRVDANPQNNSKKGP